MRRIFFYFRGIRDNCLGAPNLATCRRSSGSKFSKISLTIFPTSLVKLPRRTYVHPKRIAARSTPESLILNLQVAVARKRHSRNQIFVGPPRWHVSVIILERECSLGMHISPVARPRQSVGRSDCSQDISWAGLLGWLALCPTFSLDTRHSSPTGPAKRYSLLSVPVQRYDAWPHPPLLPLSRSFGPVSFPLVMFRPSVPSPRALLRPREPSAPFSRGIRV